MSLFVPMQQPPLDKTDARFTEPWRRFFLDLARAAAPPEVVYAALPTEPPVGTLANIADATTQTWGAAISGAGVFHVLARWNGVSWTVCGK